MKTLRSRLRDQRAVRRPLDAAAVALRLRAGPLARAVARATDVTSSGDGITIDEVIGAGTLEHDGARGFFSDNPDDRRFPAAYIARIDGGRALRHGVATDRRCLIGDLSVEAGVRAQDVARHRLLDARSFPRYARCRGPVVAVNSPYGANYYHWMLDVVPRLELLRRHAADTMEQDPTLLLETLREPFQYEVLEWLGIPSSRVRATSERSYRGFPLIVPSLAGQPIHPPHWCVRYAKSALAGIGGTLPSVPHRRLYITRAGQQRRRILNEDALLDVLTERGFEAFDPTGLTVGEQAAAFGAATHVIATHGAALTNLLFCPPGARVLEFFSPTYRPACYFLIARHLGLGYQPLLGETEDTGAAMVDPDIAIDPEAVVHALGQLDGVAGG
jgi:capsular polysaccharide biosynthesis protein